MSKARTLSDKATAGRKNAIINGNFDIWQRGTSQTSSGYGSDDRWGNTFNLATVTHSQQSFVLGQSEVPNEPEFYSRTVVASVAAANALVIKRQRIENVRTLAGQTATLSFWAKADSTKNIAVAFAQNFGTGGSPSATVTAIGAQLVPLTSAWEKHTITVVIPSISGKTIGTDNNSFLDFRLWFDAGSDYNAQAANLGQQSGTFDIAQVQLEKGSVATDFEQRPIGEELALCQRYYQYIAKVQYGGYTGSNVSVRHTTTHFVVMREQPSVAFTSGDPDVVLVESNSSEYATVWAGVENAGYNWVISDISLDAEL